MSLLKMLLPNGADTKTLFPSDVDPDYKIKMGVKVNLFLPTAAPWLLIKALLNNVHGRIVKT